MGRIQEIWDGTRHPIASRHARVGKTTSTNIHPIHQGGTRRPRREHPSRKRLVLLFSYNSSLVGLCWFLLAAELIGADLAAQIARISVELYTHAATYASARDVILADTKFEFGLVHSQSLPSERQLILIDEVLTPDSSRYWPASSYKVGESQPSFDKQYLRDWMVGEGFRKGLEDGKDGKGWVVRDDVVQGTSERYSEALKLLTS